MGEGEGVYKGSEVEMRDVSMKNGWVWGGKKEGGEGRDTRWGHGNLFFANLIFACTLILAFALLANFV